MNPILKILIVEDNPEQFTQIQQLLYEAGQSSYMFTGATSLSEVLNLLKATNFDVILLSLNLSNSTGIETFKAINELAYNIPIIIISESQDKSVAIATITEGAQDYFVKGTFTGDMLNKSILYSLERKHIDNVIVEYSEIIEHVNEAIFSLTPDNIIKSWNSAAETIYKYSADEIIGKSIFVLVPDALKVNAISALNTVKDGREIAQFKMQLYNKSKQPIESLVSLTPLKNKIGKIIGTAVLAQDYTHQIQTEKLASIQLRIATILAETSTLYNAAQHILKMICNALDFDAGEIWAVVPDENILRFVSDWKNQYFPIEVEAINQNLVFKLGEGIPGYIWSTRKAYWTSDIQNDTHVSRKALFAKMNLNCYLGFPIIFQDEILGVILFLGNNTTLPEAVFMGMLEVVGKQIGSFIKRKRLETDLLYLAQHDKLTGLANRVVAEDAFSRAVFYAQKHQTLVAVLYLDIDHFKVINDTVGHDKGDQLLKEVAQRLRTVIRETDLIARFGGDEFTIIVAGLKTKEDIDKVAKKVLDVIAVPFSFDEKQFYVTASIGISLYPHDGQNIADLLKAADFSMYYVKQTGRNNYHYSSPELYITEQKKMAMERQLHEALEKNEFHLYYQPILDVKTNEILGVEALLRWKTPDGETISPKDFIPLIEQSNLILCIGEWTLRTACNQLMAWKDTSIQTVSVNVSAHQLDFHFVNKIKSILQETGLHPSKLIFEITEVMVMQRADIVQEIINHFKDLGVSFALDNFGTGYSSFSYLNNFKIDYLKIDHSFIFNITKDPKAAAIVNAIIAMGHALSIKTIAEGVETKEQLDFLKESNCDEYQGFYYSPALEAEELFKKFFCK